MVLLGTALLTQATGAAGHSQLLAYAIAEVCDKMLACLMLQGTGCCWLKRCTYLLHAAQPAAQKQVIVR